MPTPQGLWYRAFVLIDRGLFATPKVDATSIQALKTAAATDARTVVELLTDHGRSKRPEYLPWEKINAIRLNSLTGSVEIVGDNKVISCTIPDRERLTNIVKVLGLAWETRTKPRAAELSDRTS